MSEYREMGWDDEIQNDEGDFKVLPEGDYDFEVKKFERARHSGSDKIPACNKAVLYLSVMGEQDMGDVETNLFLYSKFEWKLCQFFTAIGQRKHGEPLRMNWATVTGSRGRCHIGVRTWIGNKDGKEHQSNEVTEFYDPADTEHQPAAPAAASNYGQAPGGYTPGQF